MVKIRAATEYDVPALAHLMGELGYPTSVEEMKERYTYISSNKNYHTLVAELDGQVVGMIGLCIGYCYEKNELYVRIVAFVVDANYRNNGIGSLLMEEAEHWAKNQGAVAMGLNSGNRIERQQAHQFYLQRGYKKRSIGFAKEIR
jgi:GNAT superfamily N-acetyltransferase